MKTVLIFSDLPTHVKALEPYANVLHASGKFHVVWYLSESKHDLSKVGTHLHKLGQTVIGDFRPTETENLPKPVAQSSPISSENVIQPRSFSDRIKSALHLPLKAYFLFRQTRFFKNKIREVNPDLVFLGEDGSLETGCFEKAASSLRVPTVIHPFCTANQIELFLVRSLYRKEFKYQGAGVGIWKYLFPKYYLEMRGERMLLSSPYDILLRKLFGLDLDQPWSFVGGNSKHMIVENQFALEYYKRSGVNVRKAQVLGLPFFDSVSSIQRDYQERRSDFVKSIGFNPERPIVLCSFFPYYQSDDHQLDDDDPFDTIGEFIGYWDEIFNELAPIQVVINPHPRSDFEKVRRFNKPHCKVIDMDIMELVPFCDMFIAEITSAIRYAVYCGKPVFNLDRRNWHYDDFENLDKVWTFYDIDQYREAVVQFAQEQLKLDSRSLELNDYFGQWDGEVATDIVNSFQRFADD